MTRVEWTYTVETSRFLRALTVVGMGAIGSVFVFVVAGAVLVVGESLLAGQYAILGLVLVFALLFGRRMAGHVALFSTERHAVTRFLPARVLAAASVAWAAVVVALVAAGVPAGTVFLCVVVAVFVGAPVVATLHSEGSVDTDAGVLDADGGDASLASVQRVRRYDVGSIALLRVHYHDGAGASAPRLLTVPTEQADAVRHALESSDATPPESDRNPLVAKTLYAFAVGCLAVAAAGAYLAVSEGGDAAAVGWYGAAFAVVLAGLFGWLGSVEG